MPTDMEKLHADLIAAWNSHDTDRVVSFFTNDCLYEDVALGV